MIYEGNWREGVEIPQCLLFGFFSTLETEKMGRREKEERNCLITATNCEEITQPVMFLGMREAGK